MTSPEAAAVIRRLEENARRLRGAAAFARLLGELEGDDGEAQRLAEEARRVLAETEQAAQAAPRHVGSRVHERLRDAEIGCADLVRRLARRDGSLAPSSLRRALGRRRGRAPGELVELLGFFLDLPGPWTTGRVDKVDLLLTRLDRSYGPADPQSRDERPARIQAALRPAEQPPVGELERTTFERNLAAIVAEVEAADSLGELIESGTLQKYRELKHRLGPLLLHPKLLPAVLETNRELESKIQRLNSRTLTGIFSAYQGIFEIGFRGGLDEELRGEIDQLQNDFDRFEKRVKRREVKLTELEAFLSTLRSLSARLEESSADRREPEPQAAPGPAAAEPDEPPQDWLVDDLEALLDLLRESDSRGWPAEHVSLPPREKFQIDTREVVAFRRLEQGAPAEHPLETFLLKAAALRRAIKRSARKLAAADSESLRELPDFALARQAVALSESFLARYSQAVEQAVLDGDVDDAQRLQILRMRLVRESAGIWLQLYQRA